MSQGRGLLITLPILLFLLVVAAFWTASPVAAGATIPVTTTEDELNTDGDCSLREAIAGANFDTEVDACLAGSGTDTILLPSGAYLLTLAGSDDVGFVGDLDIISNIVISGTGSAYVAINGNRLDRVFHILGTATAGFYGVTIHNGALTDFAIANHGTLIIDGSAVSSSGAGVLNDATGTLTVTNSLIENHNSSGMTNLGLATLVNSTVSGNRDHGGIFNTGRLVGTNVTITGNRNLNWYSGGGGIFNYGAGQLTLTGSTVMGNTAVRMGGGIDNSGQMTVTETSVVSNTVQNGWGGGIHGSGTFINVVISGNTATMSGGGVEGSGTFINSVISGNTAASGGGISNNGSLTLTSSSVVSNASTTSHGGGLLNTGTLSVTNSTISHNSAAGNGGGIHNELQAALNLSNVTIAYNAADSNSDAVGDGGGIFRAVIGSVSFRNTIIAANLDNSEAVKHSDCSGVLNSQDHNLIQDTTGCTIGGAITNNQIGVDPSLGPLQNNGGSTPTHALAPNSPAVDAVGDATCMASDQRGIERPQGAACDIGAFELAQADLSITQVESQDPAPPGSPLTYTVTVVNAGALMVSGTVLTDALPADVSLASVTSTQGTCSGSTTILCNVGNLPTGHSIIVTLVVTPTMTGMLTNTVSVSGETFELNLSNNSDSQSTTVAIPIDLYQFYMPLITRGP